MGDHDDFKCGDYFTKKAMSEMMCIKYKPFVPENPVI